MASDFLLGFSVRVVQQLLATGAVELAEQGTEADVVRFVAEHLAASRQGHSLVSRLAEALLACPQVDELYADDDALKELVQDLGLDR